MPVEGPPPTDPVAGTVTVTATPDLGEVGQSIRITATLVQDPATLTLTLIKPDATTVVAQIGGLTRLSTGVYVYDYTTTLAGDYTATVISTVPNTADDCVFTTTGNASPVRLDYVKNHLNMSNITIDDGELQTVIDAAVDLAEDIIGPIVPRSVTQTELWTGTSVVLNSYPIVSIDSVTTSTGTTFSPTFTPGGICFLQTSGVLQLFGYCPTGWAETITVTYTAGRTVLTARLKLAIAELVRHLWQTQQGSRSRQTQAEDWVPSGATTKFAMELFGSAALSGIG